MFIHPIGTNSGENVNVRLLGKKNIPILSLIVRHLFVLISMAVVRLGDPEA